MRAREISLLVVLVAGASCDEAPPPPSLPSLAADPAEETGCTAPVGAGVARAKHVTCAAELSSGPLAMGRLGDLLLENALVRVILRAGGESATTIGAPAGGVLDATVQGGARVDEIKEVLPLLDFHGLAPAELVVVRAAGDEVVVRAAVTPRAIGLIEAAFPVGGESPPVHGVLEYSLRADERVLRIKLCAVPDGSEPVAANPGLAILLGGSLEVLAPGTGVLDGDTASASAPVLLAESPALGLGAAVDGSDASIIHALTVTIANAKAKTKFGADPLTCASWRLVIARSEAEAAAVLAPPSATQAIDVPVPVGGRAEIADAQGGVVLRSRELGGRVHALLAPGQYVTRAGRPGGLLGDPAAPPPTGTLVVRPTVTGEPGAPVRVTVVGQNGLAVDTRFVVVGAERRWVGPAGDYRVTLSRGSEYDLATRLVTVPADGEAAVDLTIRRVVDTSGYVATDFHLHTDLSTDSVHPVEDAVRQMAGEGLDLVASTDHDFISDLDPVASDTGVAGWLVTVAGEEVSTTTLGHVGGYPLRRDPSLAGAGALPWFDLSPHQIFQGLRDRGDDVVVQANHPRLHGSGLFDQIDLDAATGMARADPIGLGLPPDTDLSDLSFDVVEVWNGYGRGGNESTFADALALWTAGHRFVMVGNSDSHRPDLPPGAPRSYVRVADDQRGQFTWADARAGLKSRDVVVAAGIFVAADTADGGRPGGTTVAVAGKVALHVKVQAPPWADCTRLRIYRGSEVVVDQPVATPRDQAVRLDQVLTIDTPQHTFLVVRADGDADAAPIFPWPPYGLTNPIEVVP